MTDTAFVVTRRPCAAGNFKRGRAWAGPPDMVTIHVTEGSAAATRSWFANPAAEVSAHYCVNRDGTIDQFVDESDTAYHNGRVLRPTAPLVLERAGRNPNAWAIGVEHEGTGTQELTEPQRAASLWLVRGVCLRHGIPVDRRHIVGHREVYAAKTCPGKIDVDRYVRELAATLPGVARPTVTAPVPAVPQGDKRPRVVWSRTIGDWLVVTSVVSDTEWYYVRAAQLGALAPARASVPLSQMPAAPTGPAGPG